MSLADLVLLDAACRVVMHGVFAGCIIAMTVSVWRLAHKD